MKTLQFYKYACLVLLLLNISMLVFFYIPKPNTHKKSGSADVFKKRIDNILDLNAEQHIIFDKSAKAHRQKMIAINNDQKVLLSAYFQNLTSTSETVRSDSLLNRLDKLNRYKLEVTYQHFKEVKNLLGEDQKDRFNPFLDAVLSKVILKKAPPPGRAGGLGKPKKE